MKELTCCFCGKKHEYIIKENKIAFLCLEVDHIVHFDCWTTTEIIVLTQAKKEVGWLRKTFKLFF